MYDPTAVGVLQSLGNLGGKMKRLPPTEASPLLHILFEGQTVDQLHHNIVRIVGVVHIVNRHNIRMGDHGYRLALRMETPPEIFIPAQLLLEDFDRHIAVEAVTACPIHHGHTTLPDLFQNFIAAIQKPSNILIHSRRSLAIM